MELVKAYSDPLQNKNSVQIEVNRKLYMNEETRKKTDNFKILKKDLNNIIGEIIQNVNLWQLENPDVDLKKSEKLIDECFDAFDEFIKKIHYKDVKDKNKYFKALSLELAKVASDLVKKFNSL